MMKGGKIMAGLVALAVGIGLLFSNGAALADSLIVAHTGVPLGSLVGVIAGLFGIGAAADCLGAPRAAPEPKEAVALSIWAARAHVDQWDIGEN
jgi:hypothetical protein